MAPKSPQVLKLSILRETVRSSGERVLMCLPRAAWETLTSNTHSLASLMGLRGPNLTMFQKDSVPSFADLQHAECPCRRVLHISGKGSHEPVWSLRTGGKGSALFFLSHRVCVTRALAVISRHIGGPTSKTLAGPMAFMEQILQ